MLPGKCATLKRFVSGARLVTWLGGEDREAVMGEFVELHRLHAAEPNLNMMPGHDSEELTRFLKAGLLTKGF